MKRIPLLVSFCLCFYLSQAQLRVAIVGGIHQSKVQEENNLPGWDTLQNNFIGRTGGHFGFMADLRLSGKSNFYFQPGVYFSTKGRKYQSPLTDSTVVFTRPLLPDSVVETQYIENRKQFLNYIDIPLNLVYKLRLGKKSSFFIGGGPYVAFFYNGFERSDKTIINVSLNTEENKDLPVGKGTGQYKTLDYGLNAVAGFEFGRIFLRGNFSQGLSDFYEPAEYTATKYRHQLFGGSLGIFLGKPIVAPLKDKDGDGVPDKEDKCPDLPGRPELKGCPDTDNDGIADPDDKCPGEAGASDNNGCPYPDTDKDGIVDKLDQCPSIPGPKENNGCPWPDTDGDGIPDKDDQCPQIAGLERYKGCPIPDSDGDDVNDEVDHCPDKKGTRENNGCPEEIHQEIVQKVNYAAKRIQFKVNSAELTSASFKVLDDVAAILTANPDLKLTIEGHTSSDGTYEANMRLSEKRARSVKTYLQSRGVDETRLTAIGLGPDKPLNSGKTPEERAQNRRVELRLANQ